LNYVSYFYIISMMKITNEHSKKIEALISQKTFTLQDVVSLLDNLYTDNQIKYHINKYYSEFKNNLIKEYSKGETKLEYLLKEIFPYNKIIKQFQLGEKLRVDFIITAPYNLAFEYDGSQHSEYSSFFHGSKGEFLSSKQRDEKKEILLKNRGINLIRIDNLDIDVFSLEQLISSVGYGTGEVVSESLLTIQEKKDAYTKQKQKLHKEKVKQVLKKSKPVNQVSNSNKAYSESFKKLQKEYRKEQYQKQKEWLKENKKK
jgi:very-short-patch-repair endonuclease